MRDFWFKSAFIFIIGSCVGVSVQFPWSAFKAYEYKKDIEYNTMLSEQEEIRNQIKESINLQMELEIRLAKRLNLIENYFCVNGVRGKDIENLVEDFGSCDFNKK